MAKACLLSLPQRYVVGQVLTSVASDRSFAQFKAKVEKIGILGDLTVGMANRRSYHGFLTKIDEENFELTEVDLKTSLTIRYDASWSN